MTEPTRDELFQLAKKLQDALDSAAMCMDARPGTDPGDLILGALVDADRMVGQVRETAVVVVKQEIDTKYVEHLIEQLTQRASMNVTYMKEREDARDIVRALIDSGAPASPKVKETVAEWDKKKAALKQATL